MGLSVVEDFSFCLGPHQSRSALESLVFIRDEEETSLLLSQKTYAEQTKDTILSKNVVNCSNCSTQNSLKIY